MNPIEQVWKEIRKRGFKNKAFQTLEAVIDKLQEVIQGLEKEVIKSSVNRRWIKMLFESRWVSTSTIIRKLNDFHFEHDFSRLPEIMSWDVETVRGVTVSIGRWRWVLLLRTLKSSISSLFLREEHKLSFETTFLNMIELSDVEWKSLLWICLALIMT